MTSEDRRQLWLKLYREERAKLVPTNGFVSGGQISAAKGNVTKRFKAMGL